MERQMSAAVVAVGAGPQNQVRKVHRQVQALTMRENMEQPTIYAKIIADSINLTGQRLTTIEVRYPRFIHSEFMTHRAFSRNAASSRAIPNNKLVSQVRNNPAEPIAWGRNRSGMSADTELDDEMIATIRREWHELARHTADVAERWAGMGLHKQVVNRVLEPFLPITVIVTATEWNNFFVQRISTHAQPEIEKLATEMKSALDGNKPETLRAAEWHTPYVTPAEMDLPIFQRCKISVARCARVSYLNHQGVRDLDADVKLYERLLSDGHHSPFEHVATPVLGRVANFEGWGSLRALVLGH
jgi:thymidylate synthase ThyX